MKSRIAFVFAALVASAGFAAVPADASPINYIFSGTANGTLNGQAFSGLLTLTASGDTADVFSSNAVTLWNDTVNTVIDTPGLGSVTVTNPDYVFVRTDLGRVGYGVQGIPFCCDIISTPDPAFTSYDLVSDILSVVVATNASILDWQDIPTTGGLMTLSSFENFTFQAIVSPTGVPEPVTAGLLIGGLAGLGLLRRRRATA